MPRTGLPRNRRSRRGAILVLSAVMIVVICGMAAMAIDVGYMMVMKTQLQVAADAGALAAGNALHLSRKEVRNVGYDFATRHTAGGRNVKRGETKIEIGIWDADTESFAAMSGVGNAVRVTCSRNGEGLFFARALGIQSFSTEASAIAMANPKDIAFVIDLSGSMNDDTEPAWATSTVNDTFSGTASAGIGTDLMRDVYTDFGFGSFPGTLEYLGAPLGVPQDSIAYAEMTSDIGPLSKGSMPSRYRINTGDDENQRRQQCYEWIIDNQLSRLLPNARPRPRIANYGYWEKYIDYVLLSSRVVAPKPPPPPSDDDDDDDDDGDDDDDKKGGSSGGATGSGSSGGGGASKPSPPKPPAPKPPIGYLPTWPGVDRLADSPAGVAALLGARRLGLSAVPTSLLHTQVYGAAASGPGLPRVGGMYGRYTAWVPPSQDGDRIDRFNNPNKSTFPSADSSLPRNLRNYFGYLTYVQFLMDHGRDLRPDGSQYVELSMDSGRCPTHRESVAGRNFSFPPRCQPMHACRRSVISAMDVVSDRNKQIPSAKHRDRVSVVTFDTTDGSAVRYGLTNEYRKAMSAVSKLQAAGDKGTTTAAESGLLLAKSLLRRQSEGGSAREQSTRVVVMLTDGIPNAYESDDGTIAAFVSSGATADSYGGGYNWLDAPIMQSHGLEADGVDVYPVGIGLGTDYDFMDRMARTGGTGGDSGASPRGSGNPAEYEAILTKIFEKIVALPTARLVE